MSTLPSGRRLDDADVDPSIVDELAEEAAKLRPLERTGTLADAGGRHFPEFPPVGLSIAGAGVMRAGHALDEFPVYEAPGLPPGLFAIIGERAAAISSAAGTMPGAILRPGDSIEELERKAQAAGWPAGYGPALRDAIRSEGSTPLPDNGLTAFAGSCEEWLERTHARRTQPHFPS